MYGPAGSKRAGCLRGQDFAVFCEVSYIKSYDNEDAVGKTSYRGERPSHGITEYSNVCP